MPELPDVEVFKRYFDSTALHQKIAKVEVREERMIKNIPVDEFKTEIKGTEFVSTGRHGKHLFGYLSNGKIVIMHFGMTGELKYYTEPDEEPDHARVIYHFENGYHLAYDNMRMLGKVTLTDDLDAYIQEEELGPNADRLSFEEFRDLLSTKRGMIKSAFMDQSLMAGMGNIYSDEALYQAEIHPKRQVPDLSDQEIRILYDTMQDVIETAVEHQVTDFPDHFLINYRDEDAQCPNCGGQIRKIKVSSRSTYYCPECQS